ncbi:MAG: YeeE/YedE thiosulfate transporter family protein [Holophagae bacterium]
MSTESPKPYWNPYLGGMALGVVLFLSFVATGHGLGASGGIGRMLVAVQKVFYQEHVDNNALLAAWGGGSLNPLNHWLVWGIIGVAIGGFVSGWFRRRVKIETFKGPAISVGTRLAMALSGGVLMGFAARLARGCTSGQALSGGAAMSVGSWAFMFAVFAGGYLLAYPLRRFWT